MGRVHLTLSFDTEKARLWKGGKLHINWVNAHGGTPTASLIGDFQPISRNEATERTGLFEFWYRQTLGNTSILMGQHDMNSSFGTSNYGGLSINSAFGMYPSITPNTGYAFSIFPRTMPAVYVKHEMQKFTIQAAAYAGASEDFNDDRYNVKWNLDDSRFIVGEIHYKNQKDGVSKGIYKLGIIHHSGEFQDVTDLSGLESIEAGLGLYIIADHLLIHENKIDDQGLGLFFEAGIAPGNHNLVDQFVAGGVVYKGLFRDREHDELFFGILNSSINNDIPAGSGYDRPGRTILETNYAIRLGNHFTLQPDLQYIINPGASSELKNAFLGVLRFSINY
jgi:porin